MTRLFQEVALPKLISATEDPQAAPRSWSRCLPLESPRLLRPSVDSLLPFPCGSQGRSMEVKRQSVLGLPVLPEAISLHTFRLQYTHSGCSLETLAGAPDRGGPCLIRSNGRKTKPPKVQGSGPVQPLYSKATVELEHGQFIGVKGLTIHIMSDGQNLLWSCGSSGFGECIIVFHICHVICFGEYASIFCKTCIVNCHDHSLTIRQSD